jgi:hypothetical protein
MIEERYTKGLVSMISWKDSGITSKIGIRILKYCDSHLIWVEL